MPYPGGPLNNLTEYNSRRLSFGASHSHDLDSRTPPVTEDDYNTGFQDLYYDAAWVYAQLADDTGDLSWLTYADSAAAWFRDNYVLSSVSFPDGNYAGGGPTGAVSGFHIFPIGLVLHYLRNTSANLLSKNAVLLMSLNAAFSADTTPLSYTIFPNSDQNSSGGGSREVAYQIRSQAYARLLGQSARARLNDMVDQALAHINMWFVTSAASYIRPFMVALTLHGLFVYDDNTVGLGLTPRTDEIYAAAKIAGQYMKDHLWSEVDLAFRYTDRIVDDPHDMDPAPDLNLLIVFIYGWLYHQDGNQDWITFGDKVFKGGVVGAGTAFNMNGAFLAGFGKQYMQNYCFSPDYPKKREADPLATPPGPGINPPPGTPSTSDRTFSILLPVKLETWADHFVNNGWTTIQDQIDAGYKIFIEPGALTSDFEEIVDLGAIIPQAATVSLDYSVQTIDLPLTVTVQLSTSPDNVTYTDYASGQNPVFAQNFRYVKVKLSASGASGRALARIPAIRLRLTLKEIRDGGNALLGASDTHTSPDDGTTKDGTWVPFNKAFADVTTVTASEEYQAGKDLKAFPIDYDVPDPEGFAVIMFDRNTGLRAGGRVNWKAQGY